MKGTSRMLRGESFFERVIFMFNIIIKMITPPLHSFDRLQKYCEAQIQKNPSAYSPRSFLARLYRDQKKYEEAKKEYNEINLLGFMTDDDLMNLGEVLYRMADYRGVIETLDNIIDKYPRHNNANWYLGMSFMKEEEYQNAVEYLEKAITKEHPRYEDYWHIGYCYDHLAQLDKANDAYYRAYSLKPSSELSQNIASVHIKIAQSFLDTDLVRSELELTKALAIHPCDAEASRILEGIRRIKDIDAIIRKVK